MIEARKPERSIDFLPRAVLAVGITGHRDLSARQNAPAIAVTLDTLFAGLSRAVRTAAQGQFAFFAKADPFVRAVTMAAEGADLLGAQAAKNAGSAVVYVLPFPFDQYQRDFSPPAADIARSILERADAQFAIARANWGGHGSVCGEPGRRLRRRNEVLDAPIPG